jgi:hypothetical protein
MDWHGTPRHTGGPPGEKPPFQFKSEKEAYDYIIGRGRTRTQVEKLVAAAEMGHAISKVMPLVTDNLWVVQQRKLGPVAHPDVEDPDRGAASFIRQPPPMATALRTTIGFAELGIEMVEATKRLVAVAKKVRAFFDKNPRLEENLSHWKSSLQMMQALTICTALEEKLKPPLGHREMEAVALIVGYRMPGEDFPWKERAEMSPDERRTQLMSLWKDDPASFEKVAASYRKNTKPDATSAGTVSKKIEDILNAERTLKTAAEKEQKGRLLKKTEAQEEAWRKMMKKVEKGLVPLLQGLLSVEQRVEQKTP